jgi:hypothetical protein
VSPDEAVEAAAVAEAETRYRHQLAREAYETGRQVGYRQAGADGQSRWNQPSRLVVHDGPSLAELDERRWGPGGRGRFAQPRPEDFPGQGTRPQPGPETEPEMEATP